MTVVVSLVRQVGEGFVHYIVGVSREVWPHAMSVINRSRACNSGGGAARRILTDTPKDLLVTCVRLAARVSGPNA